MTDAADNMHATGLLLGDRGVLIAGPQGSGKSTLAHALMRAARADGLFARLVADDQLFLSAAGGRLLAAAPVSIAGLTEVWGTGICRTGHEPRMVVHLLVRLEKPAAVRRYQPDSTGTIAGVEVPDLPLQERNTAAAVEAVFARLGLGPFDAPCPDGMP